jgi:hypothetical protein
MLYILFLTKNSRQNWKTLITSREKAQNLNESKMEVFSPKEPTAAQL